MHLLSFLEKLEGVRKLTTGGYTAKCPAHDDRKNSLSIGSDNEKILISCKAGCHYSQVIEKIGVKPAELFYESKQYNSNSQKDDIKETVTVSKIAEVKKIPEAFLRELGIEDYNLGGAKYITIAYLDRNGEKTIRQRVRRGVSASSSEWDTSTKTALPIGIYGLWLEMNKTAPELILCEGESNSWTLWHNGFPALGVPGATMFSKIAYQDVENAKTIYILKDPDKGGEAMEAGIPKHLKAIGWKGQINVVTLPVKDASDLYCQSPETFRDRLSKILAESDKIKSLEREIKVPEFPINAFPQVFSDFVKDISDNFPTQADYPAASLLTLTSVISGNSTIKVTSKDWSTKAIMYMALIGAPGSAKTPAMEKTMGLLFEIEEELRAQNITARDEYKRQLEDYKLDYSAWKKEEKRGNEGEMPEPPQEPTEKTLLTTDATTESLAPILNNNASLLLMKDELSSWISSMDQYRAGKGADKEFYLSSWSGTFAKIDRKGRPSIFIKSPHLSIIGGIVPDNLSMLSGNSNDGFFDRLLCCYPATKERKYETPPINTVVRDRAKDKLRTIRARCQGESPVFIVTEEAEKEFAKYYNECAAKEGDFWSKMPQHCLRIALCLCLLHEKNNCDCEIMSKAVAVAKYFEQHNEKARGLSRKSQEEKEQNQIIEFARKKGLSRLKPRILQMAKIQGCGSAKKAREKMHELVDLELAFWIVENKEIELLNF